MALSMLVFVSVLVAEVLSASPSNGTCDFHGVTYKVGETFEDPQSCNTCSCMKLGVACTEVYCPKQSSLPKECHYNGRTYKTGEDFVSADGCNSCSCSSLLAEVTCTMRVCQNTMLPPGEHTTRYPYVIVNGSGHGSEPSKLVAAALAFVMVARGLLLRNGLFG